MYIQGIKLRYSRYRPWRPKGDVDARFHILAAMASPALDRLYPPVLILQEAEWTPGQVWTKSSEKNSPLRHPGSKPGRPARNLVPCRLTLIVPSVNSVLPLKFAVVNRLIHAIHTNCIVYLFLKQPIVDREVVQMWRLWPCCGMYEVASRCV